MIGEGRAHENAMGPSAVFVMIRARDGIWGLISRRYDPELFPVRRRFTGLDAAL